MSYLDTDPTLTDWHENGRQNTAERCPITGVYTNFDSVAAEFFRSEASGDPSERKSRSSAKLQAMFNRFLYQK